MRNAKLFVLITVILCFSLVGFSTVAGQTKKTGHRTTKKRGATSTSKLGATIFERECTACHTGGDNTIEAEKTLKLDALKKFDFKGPADIKKRVEEGKGIMPVFKDTLKPAEIEAVSNYVWAQAQKGWK